MEFYDRNPFKEAVPYRIQDYRNQKLTAAQQFTKNLVAYAFFELKKPLQYPVKILDRYTQEQLYACFKVAALRTYIHSKDPYRPTSVLGYFWHYEVEQMRQHLHLPEAAKFREAMIHFLPLTRKVDALIEKRTPYEQHKVRLATYYANHEVPVEFIDVEAIEKLFSKINTLILTHWSVHALVEFKAAPDAVKGSIIEGVVNELDYYLNPALLKKTQLTQLHELSCQWFEQLLAHVRHFLDLKKKHPLLEDLRDHFYTPLGLESYRSLFKTPNLEIKKQFNVQSGIPHKKITAEPLVPEPPLEVASVIIENNPSMEFPFRVFKNEAAYLFFDACARQINSTKMLSFLYRKMFEKDGLIHLRDSEFRNWFNGQDYPLTLDYPTDTYDRAATQEREEWMAIIEYFYKAVDGD